MVVEVKITGSPSWSKLAKSMKTTGDKLAAAVGFQWNIELNRFMNTMHMDHLQGGGSRSDLSRLDKISGRLYNALKGDVKISPGSKYKVKLSTWFSSDVKKYLFTQEFGATIHAKRAPYLVFKYKGQWCSKKSVVVPPRLSYRIEWAELRDRAFVAFEKGMQEVVKDL